MVDRDSKLESGAHSTEKRESSNKQTETQSQPVLEVDRRASGVLDAVDSIEDGADAMGNISENVGEGVGENRHATAGKFQQFQQGMSDEEAEDLKKKLLKSPPSKRRMIQEIRHHVNQEITQLQKRAAQSERRGKYKDLNDSLKDIRALKDLLSRIARATADAVRNMWLKVVHGIV
ncbi:MAG: hypothetical protein Q8P27_02315 [Candidatus Peregrinibacteria bacterium]|nr:hypothetical protein [Candidatus Peregrinibacteria bacterium]